MKHADIQIVERKLMQIMDMIVVKKKRVALIEREVGSRKSRHVKEASTSGVWSMLKSVASVGTSGSESIIHNFLYLYVNYVPYFSLISL